MTLRSTSDRTLPFGSREIGTTDTGSRSGPTPAVEVPTTYQSSETTETTEPHRPHRVRGPLLPLHSEPEDTSPVRARPPTRPRGGVTCHSSLCRRDRTGSPSVPVCPFLYSGVVYHRLCDKESTVDIRLDPTESRPLSTDSLTGWGKESPVGPWCLIPTQQT